MTIISPKKLKNSIETAYHRLNHLAGILDANSIESQWGLGSESKKTADSIRQILRDNFFPNDYKVAVIGRFKAGKSSFVNELLGRRLAGEDTSPETAAVTTFCFGPKVLARIRLVDKTVWDNLKLLYGDDPKNPDAQRISNWHKFSSASRSDHSQDQKEHFNLTDLERSHVKEGGHVLTVKLAESADHKEAKKFENEFRRKIKDYTSASKPHHCLVESIEIETPAQILGEGVTLIDTPGLDDTEKFRVHLTERAVQNIDAVLFLTKSGAAYGQSEKEFLLSLLRKGSIKQLLFVITQVDQTYDQHYRQSRDQDEDPDPIEVRVENERKRIRKEIEGTLDELDTHEGSISIQRYREYLNGIDIAFTSAANHRDAASKDPVRFPLYEGDPGGMKSVQDTLFKILSTESRLATARENILSGSEIIFNRLISIIENRRSTVRDLKDKEEAEAKLATFRREFLANGETFTQTVFVDCSVLTESLKNRHLLESQIVENIILSADSVLRSYEVDDAGRHWRTRRSSNWGYMHELQSRVANVIFPKVSENLNSQTALFANYVSKFNAHLKALCDDADSITNQLDIQGDFHLDISGELSTFLDQANSGLQEILVGEESRIISLLDNFIDDKVQEKIFNARQQVASIWGKGTTIGQTQEVKSFYRDVRTILRDALSEHVHARFREFEGNLISQAVALPKRALSDARAKIELASADIRAAAETTIAGKKEFFEKMANMLVSQLSDAGTELKDLLALDNKVLSSNGHSQEIAAVSTHENQVVHNDNSPEGLRRRAKKLCERMHLQNGEKGWSFAKIFLSKYFNNANSVWLVDPYLNAPHQRRNLKEAISVVLSNAKPKLLTIITGDEDAGASDRERGFFSKLAKELYAEFGVNITVDRSREIHDRYLIIDNGYVFKLGRGLDIYKPATGLASINQDQRRVRECEIDIFSPKCVPQQ